MKINDVHIIAPSRVDCNFFSFLSCSLFKGVSRFPFFTPGSGQRPYILSRLYFIMTSTFTSLWDWFLVNLFFFLITGTCGRFAVRITSPWTLITLPNLTWPNLLRNAFDQQNMIQLSHKQWLTWEVAEEPSTFLTIFWKSQRPI